MCVLGLSLPRNFRRCSLGLDDGVRLSSAVIGGVDLVFGKLSRLFLLVADLVLILRGVRTNPISACCASLRRFFKRGE